MVACTFGNYWRWDYNEEHQLIERMTPLGQRTLYDYEGPLLTTVSDPAGNRSELFYDAAGNLAALIGPDQTRTTYRHDGLGRALEIVGPAGTSEYYKYNLRGDLLKHKAPDGHVTRYEYDGAENPVHLKNSLREVDLEYVGTSRLRARTENGTRVEFQYDGEEDLTGIINEHGYAYRFKRDLRGEVVAESSFDGLRQTYERDAAGRVRAITKPGGKRNAYTLRPAGPYHQTGVLGRGGGPLQLTYRTARWRARRSIVRRGRGMPRSFGNAMRWGR